MSAAFPGTTIEILHLERGSSRLLFDGIFATGGITLSQVSVMTGLEPYLIQNWIKRGFVTSPVKRLYSREQFARIVIINMLREALQIDRICGLIHVIGDVLDDTSDDLMGDEELYHRYFDMLADGTVDITDHDSVLWASEQATADFEERMTGEKRKLSRILQVMLYAHAASRFRASAEEIMTLLE